jgi:hypothetical protein
MPIQRSGAISMSQLRAEFKDTNSGSVSFSELTRGGPHISDDRFCDPNQSVKTTAATGQSLAMSNYYNTTRGRYYSVYGQDNTNTHTQGSWQKIPPNCNRIHIRAVGGGGGGAVKTNTTLRGMGGGGASRFEATLVNSIDERPAGADWGIGEPWDMVQPGHWFSLFAGGGGSGSFANNSANAGNGHSSFILICEPVPGFDNPPPDNLYDNTSLRRGVLYTKSPRGGDTDVATLANPAGNGMGLYYEYRNNGAWVAEKLTTSFSNTVAGSLQTWDNSLNTTHYYMQNGGNPTTRYNNADSNDNCPVSAGYQVTEYNVCVKRGALPPFGDLGIGGPAWDGYWLGPGGISVGQNLTKSPQIKNANFVANLGEPHIAAAWGYGGHTRSTDRSPSGAQKYGKAWSGTPGVVIVRI